MSSGSQYVIVWEFRVPQSKATEFVERYGPEGVWVGLFRSSKGYLRTELVKDVAVPGRFLTLDYWQSEEEFERFHRENLTEYERLDQEFAGLTEKETRLGAFYRAG